MAKNKTTDWAKIIKKIQKADKSMTFTTISEATGVSISVLSRLRSGSHKSPLYDHGARLMALYEAII